MQIDFSDENFIVSGRWELHLSVLIETMRREWFELQVWAPQVIMHEEDHKKMEPMEIVSISVPDESAGWVIAQMGKRKWEMLNMSTDMGTTNLEFLIPTRWLLGFKSEFTTLTKGEGILTSSFEWYGPYKGEIEKRDVGSMISWETDKTMAYSLWKLQERWPLFVDPAVEIYEGMIIGEHLKGWDLVVNACKNKQLTNVRSSGTDEALRLTPINKKSLEEAIDYIGRGEYVEVTPLSIRIRKKYLTETDRKRAGKNG
jgi:GTP-binding protein